MLAARQGRTAWYIDTETSNRNRSSLTQLSYNRPGWEENVAGSSRLGL